MQKRILELDGFRGIAVLIVVLCHFNSLLRSPRTIAWKMLERTLDSGWVGVDIFFVLSGFLITSILLDDHDWKRFYRNRAFRILPPALFILSILAVLGLGTHLIPMNSRQLLASVFFVRNYVGHGFVRSA